MASRSPTASSRAIHGCLKNAILSTPVASTRNTSVTVMPRFDVGRLDTLSMVPTIVHTSPSGADSTVQAREKSR